VVSSQNLTQRKREKVDTSEIKRAMNREHINVKGKGSPLRYVIKLGVYSLLNMGGTGNDQ
jgi:hypothetical protein